MLLPFAPSSGGLQSAGSLMSIPVGEHIGLRRKKAQSMLLVLCLSVALGLCGLSTAHAQETASTTSDVTQLVNDLDDIDALRPVLPLKLTMEQLDKIIATVSAMQTGYDKKLKAIAGPALVKLADQIRDVKQKSLKGEAIPKDFDLVAKQAEAEIVGKRKTLDAETLAALTNQLENILTPEQVKMAAKMDKDAQIKVGKATAATQRTEPLWFASYVRDAFITVPRIVPVLKQMRSAGDTKSASK